MPQAKQTAKTCDNLKLSMSEEKQIRMNERGKCATRAENVATAEIAQCHLAHLPCLPRSLSVTTAAAFAAPPGSLERRLPRGHTKTFVRPDLSHRRCEDESTDSNASESNSRHLANEARPTPTSHPTRTHTAKRTQALNTSAARPGTSKPSTRAHPAVSTGNASNLHP